MALLEEGNGTPLQYSCLENTMDGGAWWAAVHGVAKGRTRLKRLNSSSSSSRRTRETMTLTLWISIACCATGEGGGGRGETGGGDFCSSKSFLNLVS